MFTFDNFVHFTPMIFVYLVAYFSRLFESFVQIISDACRVLYIDFLASIYMNSIARLYI